MFGTTMWNPGVRFPRISHPRRFSAPTERLQARPTAASGDQFQLTSASILVVEDVPESLTLVRVVLSRQGFEVHTATTAEEALEMARQIHPCLILADIRLPGMDGLEMTRRLKADPDTMNIAVVAVTAFAMKGDEQKVLAAGCDGYITKPIDVKNFPTSIQQYLK